MADINIHQTSSAIWWTIGIIAVAVVLWFLFAWGTTDGVTTESLPVGK